MPPVWTRCILAFRAYFHRLGTFRLKCDRYKSSRKTIFQDCEAVSLPAIQYDWVSSISSVSKEYSIQKKCDLSLVSLYVQSWSRHWAEFRHWVFGILGFPVRFSLQFHDNGMCKRTKDSVVIESSTIKWLVVDSGCLMVAFRTRFFSDKKGSLEVFGIRFTCAVW